MLHSRAIQNIYEELGCLDVLLVCGDFNLPHIVWNCSSDSWRCTTAYGQDNFLNDIFDLSLNQINKVRNANNRLLDLIFVNEKIFSNVARAFPLATPEDPHHPALEVCIETVTSQAPRYSFREHGKKVFCFKRANFDLLRALLSSIDWTSLLSNLPVNDGASAFYTELWGCIQQCVPMSAPKRTFRSCWETPHLRKLKNVKNRLFKKFKRSGSLMSYAQYAEARYRYFKCNKLCYKTYLRRVKANIRNDPKKFFEFVNTKRKSSGLHSKLKYDGQTSSTDTEAANLFAKFFASVYTNDTFDPTNVLTDIPCISTGVSVSDIFTSTVALYIKAEKSSYRGGPDSIPSVLLKECVDQLCKPLTMLFNLSLSSGIFPDLWKESFVIPLHKNGPKSMVENYRGIAKLCVIPKVFEHIISDQLNSSLQHVICRAQHGFTNNRSTVTNLLEFTSLIFQGFAAGFQTDVCYADLAKAFDRLCIALLCFKLEKIGLPTGLVKWIESYSSDRIQRVVVNDSTSEPFKVTSGVPQGSPLGPLLFNLFINDLPTVLQHCSIFMFADDVKICRSYNNLADQSLIQEDLNRFSNWCRNNCLTLNLSKCKVMTFSWRSAIRGSYTLNGVELENVNEFRDLGVLMDPKLKFNCHINAIVCKARSMLGFIKRWSKEFNDPYVTKLLFTSLVRPILEYASPVWDPRYTVHSDSIESVQKQFLLFALRHLRWDPSMALPSYESRLKLIHLPTLKSRRTCANVCFLFKLITGVTDSPALLGRIEFKIPNRAQRRFEPIRLRTCLVNYMDFEPFRCLCKDFNKFYFLICYSNSLENVKLTLTNYLNR